LEENTKDQWRSQGSPLDSSIKGNGLTWIFCSPEEWIEIKEF